MNSKQIYSKYLETLWEVMQNEYLVMLIIPQDYKNLLICKSEDWKIVAVENFYSEKSSSEKACEKTKHINSLKELMDFSEKRSETNLKTSISNNITQAFAGQNLYAHHDLTVDFNKKIILKLLDKMERKDDKLVFDNLTNLFIGNCIPSNTYWTIIQAVKEKYGEEKGIELLNSMPNHIDSFSKRDELRSHILKAFHKIEKCFGKDCHQLILNFTNKRAKQATISQTGSVDLREALIELYSANPALLEDYKETVPSIKKYLEQTEDGDFFLEKSPRIISRIVDLEELKAVTSIKANSNNHYLSLVRTFLWWFRKKDGRVANVEASMTRLNKKDVYISIFLISNPKNPLPENEFDIKLKAFAKILNKVNPALPEEISPLMDKWWDADELERKLSNNLTNKSTRTKI